VKNATGGKFNMVITDIIPLKLNTRWQEKKPQQLSWYSNKATGEVTEES
jgi:hypothetical protein